MGYHTQQLSSSNPLFQSGSEQPTSQLNNKFPSFFKSNNNKSASKRFRAVALGKNNPHNNRKKRGSSLASIVSSLENYINHNSISTNSRKQEEQKQAKEQERLSRHDPASPLAQEQNDVIKLVAAKALDRVANRSTLLDQELATPLLSAPTDQTLACCVGTKEPAISLEAYLQRLAKYINIWMDEDPGSSSTGVRSLIVSLVYIDRILINNPKVVLSNHNIHRLFMAVCLLAIKFFEDEPISNRYWAQVGGIDLSDVNNIEGKVCGALKFSLNISTEELEAYSKAILA